MTLCSAARMRSAFAISSASICAISCWIRRPNFSELIPSISSALQRPLITCALCPVVLGAVVALLGRIVVVVFFLGCPERSANAVLASAAATVGTGSRRRAPGRQSAIVTRLGVGLARPPHLAEPLCCCVVKPSAAEPKLIAMQSCGSSPCSSTERTGFGFEHAATVCPVWLQLKHLRPSLPTSGCGHLVSLCVPEQFGQRRWPD